METSTFFANYQIDQEWLSSSSVEDIINTFNANLKKLADMLVSCTNVGLLRVNATAVQNAVNEHVQMMNTKTYSVANVSRDVRDFIADRLEMESVDIQNVMLAFATIKFWRENGTDINCNQFEYTNQCLTKHPFSGMYDLERINNLLIQLAETNILFTKDAMHHDYLNKALQAIQKRIDELNNPEK